MQLSVSHSDWRVLRAVHRVGKAAPGKSLRLEMTRQTKDGTFLTNLVGRGLLKVVKDGAGPFEATYTLTTRGEEAAEFGVYQMDWDEIRTAKKPPPPRKTR